MRHLDLFSGIGGFALAASWVWGEDHKILSFCEIEKFPQKVLKKHWPDVPCHDDIKTMKGDQYGRVDILTGGFPCQPYSVAGKQRGKEDDRALWPEMLRIIKEAKPRWIIGENVAGFVNMGLDESIFDLESEGYETTAFILPACAVEANHRRDRVWIVANPNDGRPQDRWSKSSGSLQAERINRKGYPSKCPTSQESNIGHKHESLANTDIVRMEEHGAKQQTTRINQHNRLRRVTTQSPICGRNDGISNRVDRIKGLGNAIVPQVVVPIMEAIKEIENKINIQR